MTLWINTIDFLLMETWWRGYIIIPQPPQACSQHSQHKMTRGSYQMAPYPLYSALLLIRAQKAAGSLAVKGDEPVTEKLLVWIPKLTMWEKSVMCPWVKQLTIIAPGVAVNNGWSLAATPLSEGASDKVGYTKKQTSNSHAYNTDLYMCEIRQM